MYHLRSRCVKLAMTTNDALLLYDTYRWFPFTTIEIQKCELKYVGEFNVFQNKCVRKKNHINTNLLLCKLARTSASTYFMPWNFQTHDLTQLSTLHVFLLRFSLFFSLLYPTIFLYVYIHLIILKI